MVYSPSIKISMKLSNLKKDLAFYRKNPEVFMIWSIIYVLSAALLVKSFNHGIVSILMSVLMIVFLTTAITLLTIKYLYHIKRMKKDNPLVVFRSILIKPINIIK